MEEALEAYIREPDSNRAKELWRDIYENYFLAVWIGKDWGNRTINIDELQALEHDILLVYLQFLEHYKRLPYGSIEWYNYEYAKNFQSAQDAEQSLRTIRAIIAKRSDERERAFAFAQALRLHNSDNMQSEIMRQILSDGRV